MLLRPYERRCLQKCALFSSTTIHSTQNNANCEISGVRSFKIDLYLLSVFLKIQRSKLILLWLGGDRHEKIVSYLLTALLSFLSTSLSLLFRSSSSLSTWVSLLFSLSILFVIAIASYFDFSFSANFMRLKRLVSLHWC